MPWSEAAKERSAARRIYMIDEVIEALKYTLEELGCDKEGSVRTKETLASIVEKRVEENRRCEGYLKIPTIENTEVRLADANFVLSNWGEITERAADVFNVFIVWEGGRGGGSRLGTLDEYQEQQSTVALIGKGVIDKHNRRTDIINRQRGYDAAPYIGLQLPDYGSDNGNEDH